MNNYDTLINRLNQVNFSHNYHFVQYIGYGLPKMYFTKFVDNWITKNSYYNWIPYCSDGSKIVFENEKDFQKFINDLKQYLSRYDIEFRFNIGSTKFGNKSCTCLKNYKMAS